jgi:hypothetical protein
MGRASLSARQAKDRQHHQARLETRGPQHCAVYFHCQTTLIGTFRRLFGDEFAFEGNRALLLKLSGPLPRVPLAACVAMALTYHRNKRY